MNLLKLIFITLLLALFCNAGTAQTRDTTTISATYTDTIYSGSNDTCFTRGCPTNPLSVPIPPYFTITDILYSFNYRALGTCNLNQGAWDLKYRTCRSPSFNVWHTCQIALPGLCILQDLSCFSDMESCILPPQCAGYNMDFILTFYRCGVGGPGCGFSCINADGPWTMTVVGYSSRPQVQIKSSAQHGDTVCSGSNVLLTAIDSFGVAPYSTTTWSPGGMVGDSILVTPTSDTAFVAMVTDSCGNMATDTIYLKVITCTSIESYASGGFSVYPNPANTQLTLYSSLVHSKETITISIMNVLGKEASPPTPLQWRGESTVIDISMLSAGIYFLQVKSESGSVVKRFIKE